MRYRALCAILVCASIAELTACGGDQSVVAPAPVATPAPASGGPLAVNGYPVTIHEYPLPPGQEITSAPVVGPDGAIWLASDNLQIDRVAGEGIITPFTAPRFPPDAGGGQWDGFYSAIAYAGSVYTTFLGYGGIWSPGQECAPAAKGLARVSISGTITPDLVVLAACSFGEGIAGMATDSAGGLWVLTANFLAYGSTLQRYLWTGTKWVLGAGCAFGGLSYGLTYGPDGNLYVAGENEFPHFEQVVRKVSLSCTELAEYPEVTGGDETAGPDGALWIAARSSIARMSTSGVFTQYAIPFPGANAAGITNGSDGAMWFTDTGTNSIGRVTTAGAFSEFPVPTPHALGSGIVSCPQKCDGAHVHVWFTENQKIGELRY